MSRIESASMLGIDKHAKLAMAPEYADMGKAGATAKTVVVHIFVYTIAEEVNVKAVMARKFVFTKIIEGNAESAAVHKFVLMIGAEVAAVIVGALKYVYTIV